MPETTTQTQSSPPSVIINTQGTSGNQRRGSGGGGNPYRTLGVVAAVGVTAYLGNKAYQAWKQKQMDKQYGGSPASQKAVAFRNAFNPSGFAFLIDVDGTHTSAVYEITTGLANKEEWDAIITIYNKAYGESFVNRINSELNPDELLRFNEILNARITGKAIPPSQASQKAGTVTASWGGKRVKMTIVNKSRTIKWYLKESDIPDNGKEFTLAANAQHISRQADRPWIVKTRKKVTYTTYAGSVFNAITVNLEMLQLEYPDAAGKKYIAWFLADNFELY